MSMQQSVHAIVGLMDPIVMLGNTLPPAQIMKDYGPPRLDRDGQDGTFVLIQFPVEGSNALELSAGTSSPAGYVIICGQVMLPEEWISSKFPA